MSEHHPWQSLQPAETRSTASARRIDAAHPYDFFWARGSSGENLVVMKVSGVFGSQRFPTLRGLEIGLHPDDGAGGYSVVFRLTDPQLRDIFAKLAMDIVDATRDAASEQDALDVVVRRTWRWHHLLRGGSDGRLTREEQRGLIGELYVLERLLIPRLGCERAVASWCGPLGENRDFELGDVAIEAKSRGGAGRAVVRISSEFQLDCSGLRRLYLHCLVVSTAAQGEGMTVTDYATQISNQLGLVAPAAAAEFDLRLSAAGLSVAHDYSDAVWSAGQSQMYRVTAGFPAIVRNGLAGGISGVSYSIDLDACVPWAVSDRDALMDIME